MKLFFALRHTKQILKYIVVAKPRADFISACDHTIASILIE